MVGFILAMVLLSGQDASLPKEVADLLRNLRDPVPEVRHAAARKLQDLDNSHLQVLASAYNAESDVEAKAHLRQIVSLKRREIAKVLYRQGKLAEALHAFGEAEEPPDVSDYVKGRIADVRKELLAILTPIPGLLSQPLVQESFAKRAGELGPWAMPTLLDFLTDRAEFKQRINALNALKAIPEDAIPHLRASLSSGDIAFKKDACTLLGAMARKSDDVLEALQQRCDDPAEDEDVKARAKEAMKRISRRLGKAKRQP